MRFDHISYVTSHDQLSDTVQRLGSRVGAPFIDGGIHPRFGTRNFILPLQNGHYLEVVCPLDHPAADSSPFGQAVSKRASEGGGWFTWAVAVDNLSEIENRLGREAVVGHRKRPDGTDLNWKQIGILDVMRDGQLPYFIRWESLNHPSTDGKAVAKLTKVEIAGDAKTIENWIGSDLQKALGDEVQVIWVDPSQNDGENGLVAAYLMTSAGEIRLD
jgi:hypothetical protein